MAVMALIPMTALVVLVGMFCASWSFELDPALQEYAELGRWIVEFESDYAMHDIVRDLRVVHANHVASTSATHSEKNNNKKNNKKIDDMKVLHTFEHSIHGVAVSGMELEELALMHGVKHIQPDLEVSSMHGEEKHIQPDAKVTQNNVPSWGLDRISDPMDDTYDPDFTGAGVTVYVLDTGIKCDHVEFTDLDCQNILNLYGDVAEDIDDYGHGTHLAGTVGGRTVGVARGVSLRGLKVQSYRGERLTSNVLAGIEEVIRLQNLDPGRAIMQIYIRISCDSSYCAGDLLNQAIATAYEAGIVTVTPAGDVAMNACHFVLANSPHSITVGALYTTDSMHYYSNWGECVDVWAPGQPIYSSNKLSTTSYASWTGSSQAAAHVSGIIAQLWEKRPNATVEELRTALMCDSLVMQVGLREYDTLSKNLIAQTPKNNSNFGCVLGTGCQNECNGHGVCHSAHLSASSGSTDPICHCNTGSYYSETGCAVTDMTDAMPMDCSDSDTHMKVGVRLSGYWDYYYAFMIRDPYTKVIQGNVFDAVPFDRYSTFRWYCLPAGYYEVKSTAEPDEIDFNYYYFYNWGSWYLCGREDREGFIEVYKTDNGNWRCRYRNSLPTPTTSPTPQPSNTIEPTATALAPTYTPTLAPSPFPTRYKSRTFNCGYFAVSNTNDATTRRTDNCNFGALGAQTISISCWRFCGGDHYLRLYEMKAGQGYVEVATSAAQCGMCSDFTYEIPGTPDDRIRFQLRVGCWGDSTCDGDYRITGTAMRLDSGSSGSSAVDTQGEDAIALDREYESRLDREMEHLFDSV